MISMEASSLIISRLMALAEASTHIRTIKVVQKSGNVHHYHPGINLFLYAKYCSLKSTIADEVAEVNGTDVLTEATRAALIGTVDKDTKAGVKSILWENRGKLTIMDEFNYTEYEGASIKKALLQLMEGKGELNKGVAIPVSQDIEEVDDGQHFIIKKGTGKVRLKVRTAFIFLTMVEPLSSSVLDMALKSRCVMLQYEISQEEEERILDGEKLLDFRPIKVTRKDVIIKNEDFEKIREFVTERMEGKDINRIRLRVIGNCCKVYAALGRHSWIDYRLIIALQLSEGDITGMTFQNGLLLPDESRLEEAAEIVQGLRQMNKGRRTKK